ncbi:UNVERIFIED_CONTAM: hypothetical protein FKN15_077227 [Acipenser sinensis]
MQAWDADEVQALVTLWCDRSVQGKLASRVRNEEIYAKFAVDLKELGYNWSLKQCREKRKKCKRVDPPTPVLELVKAMTASDTKYMDFMQVQMQAERDFRERQMALDREQREQEREASTTLLISVLGRIGEALLTRNAKDIPVY